MTEMKNSEGLVISAHVNVLSITNLEAQASS